MGSRAQRVGLRGEGLQRKNGRAYGNFVRYFKRKARANRNLLLLCNGKDGQSKLYRQRCRGDSLYGKRPQTFFGFDSFDELHRFYSGRFHGVFVYGFVLLAQIRVRHAAGRIFRPRRGRFSKQPCNVRQKFLQLYHGGEL